jgi:hypothetical protein
MYTAPQPTACIRGQALRPANLIREPIAQVEAPRLNEGSVGFTSCLPVQYVNILGRSRLVPQPQLESVPSFQNPPFRPMINQARQQSFEGNHFPQPDQRYIFSFINGL